MHLFILQKGDEEDVLKTLIKPSWIIHTLRLWEKPERLLRKVSRFNNGFWLNDLRHPGVGMGILSMTICHVVASFARVYIALNL
ncbi:hypothetical protein N836_30555 [Leptolyngbya sp. Heron Island J]|nr:hypothetical protein N836_30555 [Leptolyngbya sp. Heron Island J]